MNGNMPYLPSPQGGGLTSADNLPAILRALAQQGSTITPANSLSQAQQSYGGGDDGASKSNSAYGDLSGQDMAQAIQAAMQFDPTTGTVS